MTAIDYGYLGILKLNVILTALLVSGCSDQQPLRANEIGTENAAPNSADARVIADGSPPKGKKPAFDLSQVPLRGTKKPTSDFDVCNSSGEAAQGITVGMMNCVGYEIERQDARLNATYTVVLGSLDAPAQSRLRSLQRAWIKARDASCTEETKEETGSLGGILYAQCILNRTIERSLWLESYSSE